MSETLLIDTDTASDDAVALILALRDPGVNVAGITVVSGNVPLAQGLINALYTAQICGADVPVYAGADRPLQRAAAHAQWFHGQDGLGDMYYPAPRASARSQHAVDAIIEIINAHPGLTLVTLGPLTNIALALGRDPSIATKVGRCVIMGGNPCCEGNVTPAAEYNIWCDPEAAQVVLLSRLPIELIGWQLCRGEAALSHRDIDQIRAFDTPLAHFALDCNRVAMKAHQTQTGELGIPLPDPVTMAVALNPTVAVETGSHCVQVETQSELTRGMTVVDRLGVAGEAQNRSFWQGARERGPMSVCWKIDVPAWKQVLCNALLA